MVNTDKTEVVTFDGRSFTLLLAVIGIFYCLVFRGAAGFTVSERVS